MWDADGIHDLGTLGGPIARAWAINQLGETVGAAQTADGATHGVLWRDGAAHDLGTLGGRTSIALDINERGDVVGFSMTEAFDESGPVIHGFLARRGSAMEDLTP